MNKKFQLKSDEIKNIAVGYGGCIATDMITVLGQPVGYMYREEPQYEEDSGWCFMSGQESQEYLDDSSNLGLYDINTIANYSSDITEYIEAPVGSAFERNAEGKLVESET